MTPAVKAFAQAAFAKYEQQIAELRQHLVGVRPSELLPWTNALRPVKNHLTNALSTIYRNPEAEEQVRSFATDALADYWSDNPGGLFDLLADANEKQFRPIFNQLDIHRDKAVALGNAAVTKTLLPANIGLDRPLL